MGRQRRKRGGWEGEEWVTEEEEVRENVAEQRVHVRVVHQKSSRERCIDQSWVKSRETLAQYRQLPSWVHQWEPATSQLSRYLTTGFLIVAALSHETLIICPSIYFHSNIRPGVLFDELANLEIVAKYKNKRKKKNRYTHHPYLSSVEYSKENLHPELAKALRFQKYSGSLQFQTSRNNTTPQTSLLSSLVRLPT